MKPSANHLYFAKLADRNFEFSGQEEAWKHAETGLLWFPFPSYDRWLRPVS